MPYGYNVDQTNIPQVGSPIDSAVGGVTQGITLGLGLQRARQDAQNNQLQQQAAIQEMERKKFNDFKSALELTQTPSFKHLAKKDQAIIGKHLGEQFSNYLGQPIDIPEWKDEFSTYTKRINEVLMDDNIPEAKKRTFIANILGEAADSMSEDKFSQLEKISNFGMKQPQQQGIPSFTFQGFSNNQPVFSSNKSPNLITGGGVTAENFIPKSEPSKIKEQQIDIAGQQDLVSSLRDKLDSIPSSIAGAGASGLAKVSGGIISPDTKAYLDIMPSAAVKIYRSTTGDTRLSDADAAARAYPIMPKPWEPKELQNSKLKDIEDALNGRNEKLKSLLTTGNAKNIAGESTDIQSFPGEKEKRYQEWKKKQIMGK